MKLITATMILALAAGAASEKRILPFDYEIHDFPNGLRLVTVPTPFPNVVALEIVVQTGSRNEIEPGKSGFAHFFEHMMFRGTREFPPEKFQAVLQQAGASNNASTSDDFTHYYTTFSKPDLETMLRMEADRFQNLDYPLPEFKTEALAVLGEYNKSIANPFQKLNEVMRATAFSKHTYQHTTIGFLKDIQDMPNQFDYSKEFFRRYYRPEYTTILVMGDIQPSQVKGWVEKYWGSWKRGDYKAPVPVEPPQDGPKSAHVDWPSPTLPIFSVAFHGPAFSDTEKDTAALDLILFLGFSENSPLYKKLVLEEQKVDILAGSNPDHIDPYLFSAFARVKKREDMDYVREQLLSTFAGFKDALVSVKKLDEVKRHLRYQFALGLDNSEAVARTLAYYIALRRTPETIEKLYESYARLTPEDLRAVARKYFQESSRTIVTLAPGGSR